MPLTGSQVHQLQQAILSAFDEPSLAQMVRIRLDENLASIAGGANLGDVVFNLITWAERTGHTEALIAGAAASNPHNPALQKFTADYFAAAAGPFSAFDDAHSQTASGSAQPKAGARPPRKPAAQDGTTAAGDTAVAHAKPLDGNAIVAIIAVLVVGVIGAAAVVRGRLDSTGLVTTVAPSTTQAATPAAGTSRADIAEQVRELKSQVATLAGKVEELNAQLDVAAQGKADAELLALMQELLTSYDPALEPILSDPALTLEDKVQLARLRLDQHLTQDSQVIAEQADRVEALGNAPSIDVEALKLKRMIDKRNQQLDLLRQIIDKYNDTAKGIIDSIGR